MSTIRPTTPKPQTTGPSGTAPATPTGVTAHAADDAEALPGDAPTATSAPARSLPHEVKAAATTLRQAMVPTVIKSADADAALGRLLALKDADLKDVTLELAAKNPVGFAALLKASPEYADGLLARLERAGAVGRAPALSATVPPHAPEPPAGPSLFRDDPALPAPLRALAQQKNLDATSDYVERYRDYRDRYGAAVDSARTVGDLRKLGPIAPPALPDNLPAVPGAPPDSANNTAFLDVRGRTVVDTAMMERVANKARALTGRPIAGTSFTFKGEAMLTLSSVSSVGASVDVSRGADGNVSGGGALKLGVLGAEGAITDQGAVSGKLKVGDGSGSIDSERVTVGVAGGRDAEDAGVDVGLSFGRDGAGASVVVGGTGGGIDLDNKKGLALDGKVGGVGGKTNFNGDSLGGALGAEYAGGADDLKFKVGAEVGFTAQGVTAIDRAGFVSSDDVGFYDAPPELERGKAWTSLPSTIRASYEALGWTEKEWSSRAGLATALVGRR